jgi:oxygen-independent coproporphyrinogen III oxidase
MDTELLNLLAKYDVPTPRYTSYPTVPYWQFEGMTDELWKNAVVDTFNNENGEISIYIHLPFCEQLCTYCACNKRITKNHKVEEPYIESVIKEWEMYRQILPSKPIIREIHLGGGTPTFFSPENLKKLISSILQDATVSENHEFSVEVHPNYTEKAHLEVLYNLGFNRISIGVQDFDPTVQFVINRMQSFEKTAEVINWAREIGFHSVNIDLIYGLPKQTLQSIEFTIEKVKELLPDRIAFYSYAHVPWKSKVQRRYSEEDLPNAENKWKMYHRGNELLAEMGFESIGMDHFALPNDQLLKSYREGKLNRNFMGYTTTSNKLIIGLGASSISDTWNAFAQNEKEVEAYQEKIKLGKLPLINGHLLDDKDIIIRKHILNLMCNGTTTLMNDSFDNSYINTVLEKLNGLKDDGLVEIKDSTIKITSKGKLFVRNISATLDTYLQNKSSQSTVFSKAI